MKKILLTILLYFFFPAVYGQQVEMMVQVGHTDRVTCIDYLESKNFVVTGGMDQVLKLWEVNSGFLVRTYKGHKGMVYDVKVSPDGKYIYSCSHDDQLVIKWDLETGNIIYKRQLGNHAISSIDISSDGNTIAACGNDTLLILKNDLTIQRKIPMENPEIVRFSKTSKQLFVACDSYDGELIKIYSTADFSKTDELKSISGISNLSLEGQSVLISNYKQIELIDLNTKNRKEIALKDSVNFSSSVLLSNNKGILYGLDNGRIYLINQNGVKTELKTGHSAMIVGFDLSSDGKYLFTASYDWSSQLIDLETGKNIKWFRSQCDYINHFSLSESGGKIALSNGNPLLGNRIGVWDFQRAKYYGTREKLSTNEVFFNVAFNEKLNAIIAANSNGSSYWYNFPKSTTSWSFMSGDSYARSVALTPNGKNGVVGTRDGKVIFWRPDRNKMEPLDVSKDMITSLEISPDGLFLVAGTDGGQIFLINYTDKTLLRTIESHSALSGYYDTTWVMSYGSVIRMNITGSPDLFLNSTSITDLDFNAAGDKIVVCGGNWVNVFDVASGKRIQQFVINGAGFGCVDFNKEGTKIVASGADGTIRIFNCTSGNLETELFGHQNEVRAVTFSSKEQYVISGSLDAQLKIWDLNLKKEILSFITANGGKDFIIYNPKGYYFASKGATKLLSYRIGQRILPFEQFDLQYNRPDVIMKDLSVFTSADLGKSVNSNLIKSYYNAYKKRLQRMNYSETDFSTELHAPVVELKKEQLKISTSDSVFNFTVKAMDSKFNLQSLNILVNGVPAFGLSGIQISGKTLEKQVNITLNNGVNKVLVYCVNEHGVKSIVENFEISYSNPNESSKVYYIGIGVKNYLDTNFNLKYSDKDVLDVADLFENKYKGSEVITLTNEEVTRENILKLKETLMKTSVNDEVVILLSGHGLLSEELDFYYATHSVNFENPKENGILFEDIESILNGIPARKKLLLLDACHSGELDKTAVEQKIEVKGNVGEKVFNAKGQKMMMGTENSFELMKELFSDLQTGTGTTIIASSSGKYFSFEYDEYQNGVFTYSLKEALNGNADVNHNGEISVSELQNYLSNRVHELTKGKQEPTSRQLNLEIDWKVW